MRQVPTQRRIPLRPSIFPKILLFVCLLGCAPALFAVTKTFVPTSGNWNLAANWNPSGVPTAADDVVITAGKTATLDIAPTINDLDCGGKINGTNNLTILGNCILAGGLGRGLFNTGDVNISGNLTTNEADLANVGNMSIGGNFNLNGCYVGGYNINAPGTITIAGNLNMNNAGNHYFTAKQVVCNGNVSETVGNLYIENNASITLAAGNTWTFNSTASYFQASAGPVNGGSVNINGTFNKINTTSLNVPPLIPFSVNGVLKGLGTIVFQGAFNNNGTVNPGLATPGILTLNIGANLLGDLHIDVETSPSIALDKLNITGNVNLSASDLTLGGASGLPGCTPYEFLSWTGTRTGSFSSVPAGYVVTYDDVAKKACVAKTPVEVCNGADDDCDGQTDEGVQNTFYADADGDSFGNINATQQACTAPNGYVANNTDCNDANPAVYPGAPEVCGNNTDEDCDGLIDEGSFAVSFQKTRPTCNGDSDGRLKALHPGGGTYTYAWSNGGTTQQITGLTAGIYSVTVTRNGTCNTEATTTLLQPNPVSIALTTVHNKCLGQSQGKVVALASGGTGIKTYAWNTGATTNKIENLPAGMYSVTATDTKGCSAEASSTVTEPTQVMLDYTASTLSNGKFEVTLTTSGGTPYPSAVPYRYCKVSPTNACAYSTVNVYTNLVAGTYTFKTRDKNACEASVEVTLPPVFSMFDTEARNEASYSGHAPSFQISPNPFDNQLLIAVHGPTEKSFFQKMTFLRAQVFDAMGRLIVEQKFEGERAPFCKIADTGAWPSGLFFVKILDEHGNLLETIRAIKAD